MKPENMLALRYIKSGRRNRILSFLTVTSIVGIMLGVTALIIVVSVMSGFSNNLKEKLLGANAEIAVSRFDSRPIEDYDNISEKIKNVEGVAAVSPFVMGQVLLTSDRAVTGAVIRGIDPKTEGGVSRLPSFITEGGLNLLYYGKDELPRLFLGKDLAVNLGIPIGGEVTLVSPYGSKGPFGINPKMRKFKVAGVFDTGIYEYNSSMAYTSVKAAQDFFNMPQSVSGLNVAAKKDENLNKLAYKIQNTLGFPYWARNWADMNKSLFSALKLEQYAMFIILTLIVVVASFNIVSMISITVKDKRKDIAILRAFGASSRFVAGIFMRQGLIVGLTGTFLGDVLALLISIILKNFKIVNIPQDVYFMDKIPVEIAPGVYIFVTLCAVTITFLAALFPALQGAKMSPINALRND